MFHYDITSCYKPAELQAEHNWPVVSQMITMCHVLGMPNISTDNEAIEFFVRASFYEKLFGLFLPSGAGHRPITIAQCRRMMGLTTHAKPQRRRAWQTHIADSFFLAQAQEVWGIRTVLEKKRLT